MIDQPAGLNVLVVGAGMYVCGLGTTGFGTVLPALFEDQRQGLVAQIALAGRHGNKAPDVLAKVHALAAYMQIDPLVDYAPTAEIIQDDAYLELARRYKVDCAIISVPDHLHYQITRQLMELGIHCLVVKPLAPTINEVDRLIHAQHTYHVYGAVEFHKRFDQTNLRIRRMIHEGHLGDILYILVEYSQKRSIPLIHFRDWVERTDIFQYLGVHYVDLIFFLTGALPRRVMATAQRGLLDSLGIHTFDAIQVLIEWYDQATGKSFMATLLTNWIDPLQTSAMSDQKIKLIGTGGRIECDQKERGLRTVSAVSGIEELNPYFSDFHDPLDHSGMRFQGYGYASIHQFLLDVRDLKHATCTLEDLQQSLRATFSAARISTAVIEAVHTSLAHNSVWILLHDRGTL